MTANAIPNYQPELDHIHREIKDMKTLMATMVDAISRIGIIEERHSAMATTQDKVLQRLDEVVLAQHKAELVAAVNHDSNERIKTLETTVRESHIEGEKNKARFDTVVFMVRAIWAVIAVAGTGGIGYFLLSLSQRIPT